MGSMCDIFPDDPMCTTEVDPSMSDIATTMGYEGIGMVITDKQGDVTIEPMLRYDFTRGEVGTIDEWVETV